MGFSVEVTGDNFTAEVVEKSYEKPVLVDFFAHWCGPCQLLKPILEKLVKEYDFVLAKVDIDRDPDLAQAYRVEGVPDVKIFTNGQVRDGFVGVLPEPKLRDLLTQLNLKSQLEIGLAAVQTAISADDLEQAKTLFNQLIEAYPENRPLLLEAGKFLIKLDKLESAEKLLGSIQEYEKEYFATAKALRTLIQLKRELSQPEIASELDELFLKAAQLTLDSDYESALQLFLDIMTRDRKYRKDGARKAMITIFELLGDEHPLTKEYRKRLMLALY